MCAPPLVATVSLASFGRAGLASPCDSTLLGKQTQRGHDSNWMRTRKPMDFTARGLPG